MRVVHLTPSYAPHRGGVETYVAAIHQVLQNQGVDSTVVTMPRLSKWATWRRIWRLRRSLQQADIIQVHDVFWWLAPVYFFVRKNIYITFHGWETVYPVRWQAKLHRWLANHMSRSAVHVGAWIQEFYWDKPDAVIYGGVSDYGQPVAVRDVRRQHPIEVVFVGRLTLDNDVDRYVEVLHEWVADGWQLSVTWVGDGPLTSLCQQVGTVTGWVEHPEEYVRKADIVFASSYLSILLAQRHGVVVGSLYGQPLKRRYLETYPGRKWLVMAGEPSLLARQLAALFLNVAKRRQLIEGAEIFAREQTWERVVAVYRQLWQRVNL